MGTHDVSILEFGDGVFEVLSTNGDTHLGGEDFDQRIVNYLAEEFAKDNDNTDIRKDPMALQRLKEAAEKAKIELSSQSSSEINLPYITALDGVPRHLVMTLTRAKFEQLCDDLFERTIEPARKALKDAGLETKDIDESSTNTQAIVFTVVHGVVTVALLAFAGLAVYYSVKKK